MPDFKLHATELAPALLGCTLCRRLPDGRILRGVITETEAYMGEADTACHAAKGKTPRNAPMYEAGGIAYIYLCYGIHELLNLVCGEEGYPEAVLLRGIVGADGPGRLTKALAITRALNREPFDGTTLWILDRPADFSGKILALPRIGIGYASEEDQKKCWRFRLASPENRKNRR